METPKCAGISRYGRKRKLTDEYKAVTGANSKKFDGIFSSPFQLQLPSVNLGRTRKSTRSMTESGDNSSDVSNLTMDPPQKSNRKHNLRSGAKSTGNRKIQKRGKKRRGLKRAIKEVQREIEEDQGEEIDGNDEFISEQLLKTDEPDLNLLEATTLDDFIDPENFRSAQVYGKIKFKILDIENLNINDQE